MIHVYAFTRVGNELPSRPGIGGGSLDACSVADVAAVVSDVGADDLEPSREAVLAHGYVVEALREHAEAVLPVRFGERFRDRQQLAATVGDCLPELRERLTQVDGCCEFGVRMVAGATGDDRLSAADGSTYMRARLAARAREDEVAAELHRPLARCSRAAVVAPGPHHAAAYLVRNEERPAFESALAGFVEAHPDVTVVCTGPWAPYTFAEATS